LNLNSQKGHWAESLLQPRWQMACTARDHTGLQGLVGRAGQAAWLRRVGRGRALASTLLAPHAHDAMDRPGSMKGGRDFMCTLMSSEPVGKGRRTASPAVERRWRIREEAWTIHDELQTASQGKRRRRHRTWRHSGCGISVP
jgi:hypothetical protein